MQVQINDRQKATLKSIIKTGKANYNDPELDRRSIRALVARELVKVTEMKKGIFVQATAKGKKLN